MLVFWWVKSDAKMLSGVHVIIGDGGGLVQWRQLKLNHLSGPFPTFLSTIPTLTTLYALLFHLTSPHLLLLQPFVFNEDHHLLKFKLKFIDHHPFLFFFYGVFLLFHLLKLADILNKQSVMNSFFAKMNWLENALSRQQQWRLTIMYMYIVVIYFHVVCCHLFVAGMSLITTCQVLCRIWQYPIYSKDSQRYPFLKCPLEAKLYSSLAFSNASSMSRIVRVHGCSLITNHPMSTVVSHVSSSMGLFILFFFSCFFWFSTIHLWRWGCHSLWAIDFMSSWPCMPTWSC